MSLSFAPHGASSVLGRASATMRALDPILARLCLQAAQTEPPLRHLPGRRSGRPGKYFWRSSDAKPRHPRFLDS
jgi:hypothetical protein